MPTKRPGVIKTVCPCCDKLMGQSVRATGRTDDLMHYTVCEVCEDRNEPQRVINLATAAIDMFDNPGTVWTMDSLASATAVIVRAYKVRLASLHALYDHEEMDELDGDLEGDDD